MLKQTLQDLLGEKALHSITVKEICERASTSRITFYTYYDDKYALLDALIEDNCRNILDTFFDLQKENNPDNKLEQRCCNMTDAALSVQHRSSILNILMKQRENIEIIFYYYRHILTLFSKEEEMCRDQWNMKYDVQEIVAFFVAGCCGYVNEALRNGMKEEDLKERLRSLLKDLLTGRLQIQKS